MNDVNDQNLLPQEMVQVLDKFVVGQKKAKEHVAHAMRYRQRRMQLEEPLRSAVQPKNILMIGSTGVGKTEIARQIAQVSSAPFIKVEATKFTEVGYMGRDVDQIIRDLVDIAISQIKLRSRSVFEEGAISIAEHRVIDLIIGTNASAETREKYLQELREGKFDDQIIEIQVMQPSEIQGNNMQEILSKMMNKRHTKRVSVQEALKIFQTEELESEMDNQRIVQDAIQSVENQGIVFIDEIDKICARYERQDSVSREGVQRDLLALIEGTEVQTKHGFVRTHHVLFICSGAFQLSKKEDLIPELQGRLPVVVRMDSLGKQDFIDILSATEFNLVKQYVALLEADSIHVEFSADGIEEIASIAVQMNHSIEDIGARRLHGLIEQLMHPIGMSTDSIGKTIVIDRAHVQSALADNHQERFSDSIL